MEATVDEQSLIEQPAQILTAEFIKENTVDLEWNDEISPQEKLFVSFYIADAHWDATKAYLMAGFEDAGTLNKTKVRANRLLRKDRIQKAINNYVNTVVEVNKGRAKVNIIELQRNRAFYDPAEFLNADGSLKYKNLSEIPEDIRSVIDGIETRYFGKDANVKTTTVKLADRDKALQQLVKILRINEEAEEEEASNREARPVINVQINGDAQISTLPEEV
jgi:hypothetical protein